MTEKARQPDARIVGREPELGLLEDFLAENRSPRTLLLTGEAGIGKTTLLEEGIERARVSPLLAAGAATFEVECNEEPTIGAIHTKTSVSAP